MRARGTSLINANVALKADHRVLDDPAWPAALKDGDLDEGYRRAEAMLCPTPYPDDGVNWPHLNKLEAMKSAAPALGAAAVTPPINVNFTAGTNRAGIEQPACNLCGDCCSGCNTGAKNTTLMNYLPDASAHGAEIFCGVRVRWVEKLDDGRWSVAYDPIGLGREAFSAEPLRVTASIVVLGAGALGSTEILLRSRAHGLALSPALGGRFTGNGDVLAFGYNNDLPIDGIGLGHRAAAYRWPRDKDEQPPVGPTITGLIDLRGTANLEEGMVIEEGAIPGAIGGSLPGVMAAAAAAVGTDTDPGNILSQRAREIESSDPGAVSRGGQPHADLPRHVARWTGCRDHGARCRRSPARGLAGSWRAAFIPARRREAAHGRQGNRGRMCPTPSGRSSCTMS